MIAELSYTISTRDISMFGFTKKLITPNVFGQGVVSFAHESILSDSGRSLGMRFEHFDGSQGWVDFLERQGVQAPMQVLYFRLFIHCVSQAAFTQFSHTVRREMTTGIIKSFAKQPQGYNFNRTFNSLEEIFEGQGGFSPNVDLLSNSDARLPFLPDPNISVLSAKYLIETFILKNMRNSDAFFDQFIAFSGTVSVAICTICRAIDQLSKTYRIT